MEWHQQEGWIRSSSLVLPQIYWLYKNNKEIKIPQSSYSRPGKHNVERSCIEMSKESLCSLPTAALPPSWHSLLWLTESTELLSQELKKKKRKEHECSVPAFGGYWRIDFCLAWCGVQTESAYSGCLGATENGGELSNMCSTREPAAPQTDTRWRKRLQVPEKKGKSNWKITQRRCVPESSTRLTGEGISLYIARLRRLGEVAVFS